MSGPYRTAPEKSEEEQGGKNLGWRHIFTESKNLDGSAGEYQIVKKTYQRKEKFGSNQTRTRQIAEFEINLKANVFRPGPNSKLRQEKSIILHEDELKELLKSLNDFVDIRTFMKDLR